MIIRCINVKRCSNGILCHGLVIRSSWVFFFFLSDGVHGGEGFLAKSQSSKLI